MAFDVLEQRFAMVGLDYQGTSGAVTDAGAFLETTDWGEDIDVEAAGSGSSHTGRMRRIRYSD